MVFDAVKLFFFLTIFLSTVKVNAQCEAGTFTVTIDGNVQTECSGVTLAPGQVFEISSNNDFTLPPEAVPPNPAGIGFALFDCDPIAAGYDLTDPATYTSSTCFLGMDPDNDHDYTTNESNICGESSTIPSTPNPVWVVPVTYDYNPCSPGGGSSGCWNIDADSDGCVDYGCPVSITYTTVTASYDCGDVFVDPGGINEDYCANTNESWLICPDIAGDPVILTFTNFELEGGFGDYDYLDIYDGDNASATYIGRFKGTTSPGTITSTAASGCIYIEFTSDSGLNYTGWEATISCTEVPPSGCSAGTFSVDIDGSSQTSCSTYNLASGAILTIQGDGNEVLPTQADPSYPAGIGFAIFSCDPVAAGYDLADPATYTGATCFLAMDADDDLNVDISESNCGGVSSSDSSWPSSVWVVPVTYDYNSCAIASPPADCGYFIDNDSDDCVGYGCSMRINYVPAPSNYVCGDVFVDAGGASGNYCSNENNSWLLCPTTAGDPITLTFSSFNTSAGDELTIYDGDDNSATALGTFSGSSIPGPFTSTAASGCLYAEFTSNASGESSGWQATLSCSNPPSGCADAGTFSVLIDGVPQASCSEYDLETGQTFYISSNGDATLPPPSTGIYPAGIGFAIFGCDPVAAGYDLNDPATYTSVTCFLDMDSDDDEGLDASETSCGGVSGTVSSWPSTVWVVPVTYDYNSCAVGGFGCGWSIDDNSDGCIDHGCPIQLNYVPIPSTYTCGDVFVDSGGADGDYCSGSASGDSFHSWLICPQIPGDPVTLNFSSFNVEGSSPPWGDHMLIYDGNNNSASLIGDFYGSTIPGPITATSASGCLFVEFTADEFDSFAGWEAAVECTTGCSPAGFIGN